MKYISVFFLFSIFYTSDLIAQISGFGLYPYVFPFVHRDKVKLFRSFSFDSTSVLIGTNADTGTGVFDKQFCFAVSNIGKLKQIKKEWVFKKSTNFSYEQAPFTIRLLKNKKLIHTWYLFTGKKGIITDDGLFVFDTLLLSKLALKNKLNYFIQSDSFSTKADYKIFKENAQNQPAFLFLTEPDTSFEGSFEVRAAANSTPGSSEFTSQKLLERCNKLMGKKNFSLFSRPATEQPGDMPETVYVIKTNRRQYDLFINKDFIKAEWKPAILGVKSYWENKARY